MSDHHHSKIEHFLIHLVAVLFLFFSVSAAYLGYGVYQNENKVNYQPKSQIPQVEAVGPFNKTWVQNSFTGGAISSSFAVPWNTDGGWDKYESSSNTIINSSGIR